MEGGLGWMGGRKEGKGGRQGLEGGLGWKAWREVIEVNFFVECRTAVRLVINVW